MLISMTNTNKVLYSQALVDAIEIKFGRESQEYEAVINGDYALGSMIEEYACPDQIPADQFIIAYEQGDEELWRYYQMFIQNEPYRRMYNLWLECMHEEDLVEDLQYAE